MRVQLTLPWLHIGIECEDEEQFDRILNKFFKQARENEDLAFGIYKNDAEGPTIH